MAGLESWWGLHWIIAAPIAFIVSYIPFVGAIVGMVGAVDVWQWEWWQAGLLFFGGIIFAIVCGGMSSFSNGYHSEKERDMSQAAFAALFLTNATATRAGIRRHKKARVAGLPKLVPRGFILQWTILPSCGQPFIFLKYVFMFSFL
ncbi:hypothetical protein [Escherichia coli]|uniref:hypothetical protein n=1 Tax=Escherichia coli TaxID=562 RepID=UPI001F0FFDD3|nr:hypothetical protein [Escherichia coli]